MGLLLLGCARAAQAADESPKPSPISPSQCPICSRANNTQSPYAERATITLVRGLANSTFGWTEMLTQPRAEVEQGGNLAVGMGKGVGFAIKRTAEGIGELFTFWVPRGERDPALAEDCPICALPRRPQSTPAEPTAAAASKPPTTSAKSTTIQKP